MSSQQRNFFETYARGQGVVQESSYSYSSTSGVQGQTNFEARRSEVEGEREAFLKFSQDNLTVVSGSTDYSKIALLKDAILELKSSYFSIGGISVKG